jgi:hypothetical protein
MISQPHHAGEEGENENFSLKRDQKVEIGE